MSGGAYYSDESVTLYLGDCIEVMRAMPDASVDSIVTDPPYGLGFMGKGWDDLPPGLPWATECLRVLKPGGHLLAFGGSRTWHRLACAVEDAGFEMRDSIAWLYGSGFPKSLDVSKAIDKATGAEREVVGKSRRAIGPSQAGANGIGTFKETNWATSNLLTAPATPEAARWQGWGTALKPAFEPIVMGRKPIQGTVAANVLAFGTGALNVDGCRVASVDALVRPSILREDNDVLGKGLGAGVQTEPAGRWPTNVILDESQAAELDRQSGNHPTGALNPYIQREWGYQGGMEGTVRDVSKAADSGGASRFFPTFRYEAKAPTTERPSYEADGETVRVATPDKRCTVCGRQKVNVPGAECKCPDPTFVADPAKANRVSHPTVKPLDLMRWLVRLVTPPGGIVLEPFAGSGTTAEACVVEGFRCIAIEREATYLPLIVARLSKPIAVTFDLGSVA